MVIQFTSTLGSSACPQNERHERLSDSILFISKLYYLIYISLASNIGPAAGAGITFARLFQLAKPFIAPETTSQTAVPRIESTIEATNDEITTNGVGDSFLHNTSNISILEMPSSIRPTSNITSDTNSNNIATRVQSLMPQATGGPTLDLGDDISGIFGSASRNEKGRVTSNGIKINPGLRSPESSPSMAKLASLKDNGNQQIHMSRHNISVFSVQNLSDGEEDYDFDNSLVELEAAKTKDNIKQVDNRHQNNTNRDSDISSFMMIPEIQTFTVDRSDPNKLSKESAITSNVSAVDAEMSDSEENPQGLISPRNFPYNIEEMNTPNANKNTRAKSKPKGHGMFSLTAVDTSGEESSSNGVSPQSSPSSSMMQLPSPKAHNAAVVNSIQSSRAGISKI